MKNAILIVIAAVTVSFSMPALLAQDSNIRRFGPNRNGGAKLGQTARSGQCGLIEALPLGELSDAEIDALIQMREEEKLARDVYMALFEAWEIPIFWNIAESEQRHFDAVGTLLEKYGLEDPAFDEFGKAGVFTLASGFGPLYETLVAEGMSSLEKACLVGATIEDMDIYDLRQILSDVDNVDNQDIRIVFQNLLNGSMNHLRAFNRFLSSDYVGQYLSPEEIDEILYAPRNSGRYGEGCGTCGRPDSGRPAGGGDCRGRGGTGN